MIGNALNKLEQAKEYKIIGIEGVTASGKSILAQVLTATGSNTILIDLCDLLSLEERQYDVLPLMKDLNNTYIIDAVDLADNRTIHHAIHNVLSSDGTVVLLYMKEHDIPESVRKDIVRFKITQTDFVQLN